MAIQTYDTTSLPPSPFIRELGEQLRHVPTQDILDVGCSIGRNALYLAEMGHRVIGIDVNLDELHVARRESNGAIPLIAADVRNLMLRATFDVVMMNEVLHQMPKQDGEAVLKNLRTLTRPGGFHAISDYIGPKPNALSPFELYDNYRRAGWDVLRYYEQEVRTQNIEDNVCLNSLATIIATRP